MITERIKISGARAGYIIDQYQSKLIHNPGDCGLDLYPTCVVLGNQVPYEEYQSYVIFSIPTEVHIGIPEGYFGMIVPRSSSVNKLEGADVVSGIIDSGYTGEYRIRVKCLIQDMGRMMNLISELASAQVALAQLIIIPFATLRLMEVSEITGARGHRGYGSTDKNT